MKKAIVYIDGFNFFHATKDNPSANINLASLAESLVLPGYAVEDVVYFSAHAKWRYADFIKHCAYIARLRANGVTVVLSHFKKRKAVCHKCGATWTTHEEKETDVRISLQILKDAEDGRFDTAYILSGDSDIVPAIEAVKERHPNKKLLAVLPKHQVQGAYNIKQACDGLVNLSPTRIAKHKF